jgi:hypothetical protein
MCTDDARTALQRLGLAEKDIQALGEGKPVGFALSGAPDGTISIAHFPSPDRLQVGIYTIENMGGGLSDNFKKYELMRDSGSTAEQVYQVAVADGIDAITRVRLVRAVFALSPRQAKEVIVRAERQAESLDQYQERIAQALE